jgi:hypothetical protein
VGPGVFDYVLVNADLAPASQIKPEWQVQPVELPAGTTYPGVEFVHAPVVNPHNPLRHDPDRLAQALLSLYEEKRQRAPAPTFSTNGHGPEEH